MATTYVVSLLYFDVLASAGGFEGLYAPEGDFSPETTAVEDRLVTQGLDPVLDLLEAHPSWHLDIGFPAYTVEVLAERHPASLDRLRALAKAGQIELVSVQWGSNFFLAFPGRDQEVSVGLARAVFADHDLPLSPIAYAAGAQFGPGVLERLPDWGYDAVVVDPELYTYTHGSPLGAVSYAEGGTTVLAGGVDGSTGGAKVTWAWYGDGAGWASNGGSVFSGAGYHSDSSSLRIRETQLMALEEDGGRLVTLSELIDTVGTKGGGALPEPLLDGVLNTEQADNVWLWMGYGGMYREEAEADNAVLTAAMAARHKVAAAELVPGVDAAAIDAAWRDVLLAENLGATGQNPYVGQVAFALDHAAAVDDDLAEALAPACDGADSVVVDIATGAVTWDRAVPAETGKVTAALFPVIHPERVPEETWTQLESDVWRVDLDFSTAGVDTYVAFGWDMADVWWVPALTGELASFDADAVTPRDIALPNAFGVAHLDGDYWMVKRTDSANLAMVYRRDGRQIGMLDETDADSPARWSFYVVRGDEARALEIAYAKNVAPTVWLPCPDADGAVPGGDDPGDTDGGHAGDGGGAGSDADDDAGAACGCANGGGASGLGALGLAVLALRARRRPA